MRRLICTLSPYGNEPISSAAQDQHDLMQLAPKKYKSMESEDFLKSKHKHLYAPITITGLDRLR